MKISLDGAYAIVAWYEGEKSKPVFCKLKVQGNELIATVQNLNAGTNPDSASISLEDVIAVIQNPNRIHKALAYNCKILPFVNSAKIEHWGDVSYFTELLNTEMATIRLAFKKVHIRLVLKYKLKWLLQPIDILVLPNTSRTLGSYKINKQEGSYDLMTLSHADYSLEEVIHTIAHECGHKIWASLSDKYKNKWINYYTTGCKVTEITASRLASLRADWVASNSTVKNFSKLLEDEDKRVFETAIGWVSSTFNLKVEFLNVLRSSGNTFKTFWPTTPSHVSDIEGLVSEYSAKNPIELFCESLGSLISKKELPKEAEKLIVNSLNSLNSLGT